MTLHLGLEKYNGSIHKALQGADIELSPPLLQRYVVEGVTVLYPHPVYHGGRGIF